MSNPTRKPRGNSVLKTLPEDRQESIIAKLKTKGQTYAKVRKWLADDGIETSETALGDFWQWWHTQQRWQAAADIGKQVQSLLKEADPSISSEQLETYGQAVFLNEAIAAGGKDGLEGFVSLGKLRLKQKEFKANAKGFELKFEQKDREIAQKDEALRIARQKFQRETCELFLKWQANEQAKAIATSGVSNSEKIEALGQAMFGEDWNQ